MKRPIFFTSFFSMNWKGSKLRTSAAIWQAKAEASNPVMRSTPLLPASSACHTASVVLPTEQIRPMPVTTTRLGKLLCKLPCKLVRNSALPITRRFTCQNYLPALACLPM